MSKEELLTHIKAAIDLETDIAIQKSIISKYEQQCEIIKPQLEQESAEKRPPLFLEKYIGYLPKKYQKKYDKFPFVPLGLGLLLIIFTFIIAITGDYHNGPFTAICTFVCIFSCIIFAPCLYWNIQIHKENIQKQQKYQSTLSQYNAYLQEVNERNKDLQDQYNHEFDTWRNNASSNRELLSSHLQNTQDLLDKLYAQNFIYEKYRNLPALTCIYEYLQIGRCDELSGPHGAYNIYEDEIRKDTMISQLNQVIENLEQIKQSQYMLYQQAKIISDNTTAISREINSITVYTEKIMELSAVSAYYNALIARNTDISATCHLLNG